MDLQEQAEHLIKQFCLDSFLSDIGESHLVGNIALGTTVKPDIDYQIYAKPEVWIENSNRIVEYLRSFGLNDYIQRDLKESRKYLTSFSYIDSDNIRWSIDITQTTPNDDYLKDAYKFFLDYSDRLTDDKREVIKKLKKYFLNQNKLHHSMSYYIYKAVIDENANTVSDIYDYLTKNKIYLGKFKKIEDNI